VAKILVCGSIAFDNIMEFPGEFGKYILPEKLKNINVSFLVNKFKKVRGGTAPNIAYNLALVGEEPYVLGSVGSDFSEYRKWLNDNGVSTSYIRTIEDDYTANCFITTDKNFNQITTFYPGAMSRDIELSIKGIDRSDIKLAIIAPTSPEAMVKWAKECKEINLPYMFDPGMQIPRLEKVELIEGIMGSKISIFNNYEYEMMINKTSLTNDEILTNVELIVITNGEKGSVIISKDGRVNIKPAKVSKVIDPTGAGDAYRAGFIKGYIDNESIDIMGKYGSVTAVYAVEYKGATVHKYTLAELNQRYIDNFANISPTS
jgi:adenosine kinase